jgi:hypothetical protein
MPSTWPRSPRSATGTARGAYYDKKIAEGKAPKEALRALKSQVSDAFYKRMKADARRAAASTAGPGGHPGNDSVASAAGLHPADRLFGQATPDLPPPYDCGPVRPRARARPAPGRPGGPHPRARPSTAPPAHPAGPRATVWAGSGLPAPAWGGTGSSAERAAEGLSRASAMRSNQKVHLLTPRTKRNRSARPCHL